MITYIGVNCHTWSLTVNCACNTVSRTFLVTTDHRLRCCELNAAVLAGPPQQVPPRRKRSKSTSKYAFASSVLVWGFKSHPNTQPNSCRLQVIIQEDTNSKFPTLEAMADASQRGDRHPGRNTQHCAAASRTTSTRRHFTRPTSNSIPH